jgi:signal transduction histidine kinase
MSQRTNIMLRRTVVISLVIFSIFITAGVFMLFRSSLSRDEEHIRFVTLTGDVESGILKSRIWVDEIIFRGDNNLMPELYESFDTLDARLGELGDFLHSEYSRYRRNSYPMFSEKYERMMDGYSMLREGIYESEREGVLALSDTALFNNFNEFNLSFRDFRSFIPEYLLLDKQEYRTEIVGVMVLNALLIIVAGFVILRLARRLAAAERTLVMRTIEVENSERERIAADLHDGLGALLSGLMIHIQVLQKESEKDREMTSRLQHLQYLATGALTGIEEIINNLNPSMLTRHGLTGALRRLIKRINESGKTQFAIETCEKPVPLEQGTELLLFRICSELINNTLKHSGAQNALLRFRVEKRVLVLRYLDDGIGFEYKEDKIEERKSGLNNIVQRVESMNGSCLINTAPGQGVEVIIRLPLEKSGA